MSKADTLYLNHIYSSILKIEKYLNEIKKEEFFENDKTQDAVIRQFEILGEATKRLSSDIREHYPIIPWKDIAGMRDKLIHDYMGVDLDLIWQSYKKDIPFLKINIKKILFDMGIKVE